MALDGGGGGGGGPVGSTNSFTGAAEALELTYPNRAYAYSGLIEATATMTDYIDFTTGNYTFDGIVQCVGFANPADTGPGTNAVFRYVMNGAVQAYIKVETTNESMPSIVDLRVIIPAYTQVQVGVITDTIAATKLGAIIMMGEIFR